MAIAGIEMVHPGELDRREPLASRIVQRSARTASWNQARSYVEMLAGRGLYFQVALESRWSTRLARVREFMRLMGRDATSSRIPP